MVCMEQFTLFGPGQILALQSGDKHLRRDVLKHVEQTIAVVAIQFCGRVINEQDELVLTGLGNEAGLCNHEGRTKHFLLPAGNPVTGSTIMYLEWQVRPVRAHLG